MKKLKPNKTYKIWPDKKEGRFSRMVHFLVRFLIKLFRCRTPEEIQKDVDSEVDRLHEGLKFCEACKGNKELWRGGGYGYTSCQRCNGTGHEPNV